MKHGRKNSPSIILGFVIGMVALSAAPAAYSAAAGCVAAPDGLVSWWQAEGNALDSADGNNGSLMYGAAFASGKVGQGFTFGGGNSRILLGDPENLKFTNSFSIETWIYATGLPTGPWGQILMRSDTRTYLDPYYLAMRPDGGIRFHVEDDSGSASHGADVDTTPIPLGQWKHVAGVFDATAGTLQVFIDGALIAQINTAVKPFRDLDPNAEPGMSIGNTMGFVQGFNGMIDELGVYARALSPTEIQAIYNAGSAGKCAPTPPPACVPAPSGLISWWRADGNAVDSVDGNHGTLLNGVGFAGAVVGEGFSFDGVDDRITVSNSPSLNFGPGQDFSIEAWIQPQVSSTAFGVMSIVDKRLAPSISQGQGYEFDVVDGRVSCRLSDSMANIGTGYGPAGPDLRDGYFHHVAMTVSRNSTTGGRLFVDGQAVLIFDPTGEPGDLTTSEPLRIGNHATPSLFAYFKGMIDEVSIYNRALGTNEITAIYAAGSEGKCVPPPPASCVPAPDNLVSWWRAENNASDEVGGNNGMLIGNVSFVPGKVGLGFGLNGSNSFVQIPHHVSLNLTNQFTLEFWYLEQGKTWWYSMITKRNSGFAPANFGIHVNPVLSQGLQLFFTDPTVGGDSTSDYLPVPSSGVFHHLAATFRQADSTHVELKTFVDGQLVKTTTVLGNLANTLIAAPILIGADYAGQDFFKGIIDEVSIYNRALPLSEVQAIYTAGSAGKCAVAPPACVPAPAGLVSWWRTEGNVLDSADGNNGTLAGNTTYVAGRVGQGLGFDGRGDLVPVGNPTNLQLQNFSIEAWVKRASTSAVSYGSYGNGVIFGYGYGGYGLYLDASGRPALSKIGLSETKPAATITDTNFHHLAVTKSGNIVVFYIDGVAYPAPAYDPGFVFSTVAAIGARGDNLDNSFLGTIDETSVYNRALSATEVQAIYNAGGSGKCAPPPPPACVAAPSGLMGWWPGEGNGLDSVGAHNGTMQGGAGFAAGKVGQAFNFNGLNSAVDLGAWFNYQTFTVSMWVNPGASQVQYADILDNFHNERSNWVLQQNSTIRNQYYFAVPLNGTMAYSTFTLASNQWQHLVITRDLRNHNRVYVNGALAAEAQDAGPVNYSGQSFRVGGHASNVRYWNGQLDELAVFDRALTTDEVQAIYAAGSAGKCKEPPTILTQPVSQKITVGLNATFSVVASGTPQLRYQWQHDDLDLAGATDSVLNFTVGNDSGGLYSVRVTNAFGSVISSNAVLTVNPPPPCVNVVAGLVSWWRGESNAVDSVDGNNGTLQNGVTFAGGKVGQAFAFDGTTGSVMVAASSNLNVGLGGGLSIETWIKPSTVALARPIAEWNSVTGGNPYPYGAHFWISTPVGYGAGPGCLYANIVDTAGRFHWLTSAGGLINTNSFQHVAMTYDKTSGLAVLYLNGAIVAQKNLGSFTPQTSYNLYLGRRPGGVAASYSWAGLMDEVSLYSRALSQGEIQTIFNSSVTGKCQEPPVIMTQPVSQKVTVGLSATFSVVAQGTPQFRYQWRFNGDDLAGATSSMLSFTVSDTSGGLYSVRVTNAFGSVISANAVLVVNHPPVADASATKPLLIVPPGCSLTVVLDGSRSSDPDADPLQYRWFKTGESNAFATGVVAVVPLPLGAHSLTLVVDDGLATDAQTFAVELITPAPAVERLIALVKSQVQKPNPLVATLSAALASIERGNFTPAINQLEAFQNKVRVQVLPDDPALAGQFLQAAQAIIDTLSRDCASAKPHGKIGKVNRHNNGKVRMEFSAPPGPVYLIEASTNLVDWEKIGVVDEYGPGEFEFEDPDAARLPARFYRIVSP